jgi:hypothetical protein
MSARARRRIIGAAGAVAPTLALLSTGVLGPTPLAGATPAAPQACPQSVLDRYEAGEEVTVVGYTSDCVAVGAGATTSTGAPALTGAVSGYLHTDPCIDVNLAYCVPTRGPSDPTDGTPVGRFTLSAPSDQARGQRMQLTFRLPDGLASGLYYLVACEDPCAPRTPGHLATTPLYVGVDPPADGRPVRHWPLDDPALASIADDALVEPGDGRTLTGAEVRAARGEADPTDLVIGDVEAAAADRGADDRDGSGGDASPWQPPGWTLATALVLAVVAVAGWRRSDRTGTDRKQVRPSGTG